MNYLDEIKQFFKENKELIIDNDFKQLYDNWSKKYGSYTLTCILLDANINPLLYMTEVYAYSYYYLQISKIIIPDNITYIMSSAFLDCHKLTSVILPNNLQSIGMFAFARCYKLKAITLPKTINRIGQSAFYEGTKIIYEGSKEEWEAIPDHIYFDTLNIEFLNK